MISSEPVEDKLGAQFATQKPDRLATKPIGVAPRVPCQPRCTSWTISPGAAWADYQCTGNLMLRRRLGCCTLAVTMVALAACSSTTGGSPDDRSSDARSKPSPAATAPATSSQAVPAGASQDDTIVAHLKAYFKAHPTDDSASGDGSADLKSCPLGDPMALAQSYSDPPFTAKVMAELPRAAKDHLYYIDGAFDNAGVYDIVCKFLPDSGPDGARFEVFLYPTPQTISAISSGDDTVPMHSKIDGGTLLFGPAPTAPAPGQSDDQTSVAVYLGDGGFFTIEASSEFHSTTPPYSKPALVSALPVILGKLSTI